MTRGQGPTIRRGQGSRSASRAQGPLGNTDPLHLPLPALLRRTWSRSRWPLRSRSEAAEGRAEEVRRSIPVAFLRAGLVPCGALVVALTPGCSTPGAMRVANTPVEARALELAEEALLADRLGQGVEALALWARAAAADPSWITPRRALQLGALGDLRGPSILEDLRSRAASPGEQEEAADAYLMARLLPPSQDGFLPSASRGEAWGAHGVGVHRFQQDRFEEAVLWSGRAVEWARCEQDRVRFLLQHCEALARLGEKGRAEALVLLREAYTRLPEPSPQRADLLLAHHDHAPAQSAERAWWEVEASRWVDDPRLTRIEARRLSREALGSDLSRALDVRRGPSGPAPRPFLPPLGEAAAWDKWLAELPREVMAEDGLPADPAWRELVRLARRGAPGDEGPITAALVRVGAFEEAVRLSEQSTVGGSLHALASREASTELRLGVLDLASERLRRWQESEGALSWREPEDPAECLAALDQRLDPFRSLVRGLEGVHLEPSTLLHLGPVATLLVPLDASARPQPGAGDLLAWSRAFLQVTWPFGMRPQVLLGTLMHAAPVSGELLGRPWRGTRAILRDVSGTAVGGAAHPGGYWVDFTDAQRSEARWRALARQFRGRGEALQEVLDQTGLSLNPGEDRSGLWPLLGEGDRVALAVMGRSGELTAPRAAELLAVSMRHEEAHLADYQELLPVWRNLPGILGLVARGGFAIRGTWARVEARAQLVALCVSPEPRIALAEVLWKVEELQRRTTLGPYPHAEGYSDLLEGLMEVLEAIDPRLDPSRTTVHQLHGVEPGVLREAGLRLARDWGLVAPGWNPRD